MITMCQCGGREGRCTDMSLMERRACNLRWKKKTLSGNNQKKKNKYHSDHTEAYPYTCRRASMTVEAAVILPLFVGFMVVLMFYFRMMQVQLGVEQAMAYTARITAASSRETGEHISKTKVRLLFAGALKREKVPLKYVDGGMAGISVSKSDFTEKEIIFRTSYKMTLPVGFFGKLTHGVRQEVSARKWTGWIEEDDLKADEAYVYVTETGRAYHKSRDCAYLDLSIHAISSLDLHRKRNKNGERYRKCSSCCKKGKKAAYYITDYGVLYHGSISCKNLKRTVYLIPIEKVGKRHGCGKCTGG